MPKVYFYSDFDGTLTKRRGFETICTPFYLSLFKDEATTAADYYEYEFKDEKARLDIFRQEFGETWPNDEYEGDHADMLMPSETVAVLRDLLNNEQVCFSILTKNRPEYIQTLLQYQGFTPPEITKISIAGPDKRRAIVKDFVPVPDKIEDPENAVFVLDDDNVQLNQMLNAICQKGRLDFSDYLQLKNQNPIGNVNNVYKIGYPPGEFNWQAVLESAHGFLKPPSAAAPPSDVYNKDFQPEEHTSYRSLNLFAGESTRLDDLTWEQLEKEYDANPSDSENSNDGSEETESEEINSTSSIHSP